MNVQLNGYKDMNNSIFKRSAITFMIAFISLVAFAQGEGCYNNLRSNGVQAMEKKEWKNAITILEMSKLCPDMPRNNDIDALVWQCRQRLNPKPAPIDYSVYSDALVKKAEEGDAVSQYALGLFYDQGHGVSQDYTKAFEWFKKAAEKGDSAGQYSLGDCYYNGEGVEQNYFSAVEWYTKAANQGIVPAYRQLGICYVLEQGVARDLNKAKELLSIAAEKGDSLAQRLLNKIQK